MTKGNFRDWLGGFIVGGFLGAGAALYVIPVPATNHDLIVFMLGQLSGFAGGVVAYHFGTNASSARKTELMGNGPTDVTVVNSASEPVKTEIQE